MAWDPTTRNRFHTTRWTLVRNASGDDPGAVRRAIEELCAAYWYPLYAWLRRRGHDADEAQDLVQDVLGRICERGIGDVDEDGARFRSFLLAAVRNRSIDIARQAGAEKRGGGDVTVPLPDFEDGERRYGEEPSVDLAPDRLFDRGWARTVLARVFDGLRAEQHQRGRGEVFDRLKAFLIPGWAAEDYRAVAADLGLGEGALRVAVHRLRARFRELLECEVAHTVGDADAVADEIRWLFRALA